MNDLTKKVMLAGVVGAGGGGFPTYVKISNKVNTLIANGAECEPLLYSDQFLMENHLKEILEGILIVKNITGAQRVIFATKEKYSKVVEDFRRIKPAGIELFLLGDFYPSGDEFVLVNEVTGEIIPEGGIPIEINTLVQNVTTLYNIYLAVKGEPVIEKCVTVCGFVKRQGVYIFPVGTTLRDVIFAAGGATIKDYKIIDGGPMMGICAGDEDEHSVQKTTSAIIVLPSQHNVSHRKTRPFSFDSKRALSSCCQCRLCTDICPRYLIGHSIEPHKIMRALAEEKIDDENITKAFLCSLCGVCEVYACPMGLSPRAIYQKFKEECQVKGIKNPHRKKIEKAREEREYRKVPKERLIQRLEVSSFEGANSFYGEFRDIYRLVIPLKQHVGVPAKPALSIGDKVKRGDIIGVIEEGRIGAFVHSSMDGVVRAVDNKRIIIER